MASTSRSISDMIRDMVNGLGTTSRERGTDRPDISDGYGEALPLVIGTRKVTCRPVWLGYNKVPTLAEDVWAKDMSGSWTTQEGYATPAMLAICQGPAAGVLSYWRGDDLMPSASFLARNSAPSVVFVSGSSAEGTWTYRTSISTVRDLYSAQATYGQAAATLTVPNASTWAGDVKVVVQLYTSFLGGLWSDTNILTKVSSNPGIGQYSVAGGTYTICTAFGSSYNGILCHIHFERTASALKGYSPATAVPLRNTAHLRVEQLGLLDQGSVPEVSVEVQAIACTAPNGLDSHPADALQYLWSDPSGGLGMPSGSLDTDRGTDGSAASSYRAYCTAMEFHGSLALEDFASAEDAIADIMAGTNSRLVRVQGGVRAVPWSYDGSAVGGYVPVTGATTLDDANGDFLSDGDADPIAVELTSFEDVYNCWPVEYQARTTSSVDGSRVYVDRSEEAVVQDPDRAGDVRRADAVQSGWIADAAHAKKISYLMGLRSVNVRSAYSFTVGPRHAYLEPGDTVLLTGTTVTAPEGTLARITSFDRTGDGTYSVRAEDCPIGNAVPSLEVQATDGAGGNGVGPSYGTVYAVKGLVESSKADLSNAITGSNDFWNMIPNPNCEATAPAWADTTLPAWRDIKTVGASETVNSGSSIRFLQGNGTDRYTESVLATRNCTPADSFVFRAWANPRITWSPEAILDFVLDRVISCPASGSAYAGFRWRDMDGNLVQEVTASCTGSGGSWELLTASGTSPSNAVWVDVLIGHDSGYASGTEAWFGPLLAVPSISTWRLDADCVTARELSAGCVVIGSPTVTGNLDVSRVTGTISQATTPALTVHGNVLINGTAPISALTGTITGSAALTVNGNALVSGTLSGTAIAAGTINTSLLAGDCIKTSNYAESGSNPTAGVKLDITGTALKVAPGNLQIGSQLFSEMCMPRAWGRLCVAASGNVTIQAGYGISSAYWTLSNMTINMSPSLGTANYAVFSQTNLSSYMTRTSAEHTNYFYLIHWKSDTAIETNWIVGEIVTVVIFGVS